MDSSSLKLGSSKIRGWEDEEDPSKEDWEETTSKMEGQPEVVSA